MVVERDDREFSFEKTQAAAHEFWKADNHADLHLWEDLRADSSLTYPTGCVYPIFLDACLSA